MTTESIYQKYVNAVQQVSGDGTWVDWGVVRLALRLAVQDAYTAGTEARSGAADDLAAITANQSAALQVALDQIDRLRQERNSQPDLRLHEFLQAQITRLNEWLSEHEPGLYISPGDTADAILDAIARRDKRIAEYDTALSHAQNEAGMLRQQLVAMDADNAGLTKRYKGLQSELAEVMESRNHWLEQLSAVTEQRDALQQEIDRLTRENTIAVDTVNSLREPATATNGNGASPAAAAPLPATTTWYDHLDDETNDWRLSLEAGRRTFRQLNKRTRLLLAQAVARHVGNGAMPTQPQFDAAKPTWMPGGGSLAVSFGANWSELLKLTPFEVEP